VELTPEERHKIYEEEKARLETPAPAPETKPAPTSDSPAQETAIDWLPGAVIAGALFIFGVLMVIWITANSGTSEQTGAVATTDAPFTITSTPSATPTPSWAAPTQGTPDYTKEVGNQVVRITRENQTGVPLVTLMTHVVTAKSDQPYDDLRNNPGEHVGKPILFEGTVQEVMYQYPLTALVVNRNGYTVQPVAVAFGQEYKTRKGKKVSILGYCAGLQEFHQTNIPSVAARIVTTPKEMAGLFAEARKLIDSLPPDKK